MSETNSSQTASPLVSTQWLAENLGKNGLSVVDGSWYLPAMERDGAAEYQSTHIPGAVYFDIDAISDQTSPLPHTMPDKDFFATEVGKLGISEKDHIIVYDGAGLFSAARVWWMFRTFGAAKVSVLDGGLAKWTAEGHPVEAGTPSPAPAKFNASFNAQAVAYTKDVIAAVQSGTIQIADARAIARFDGSAPEPRPGLPSGHMPGAKNLAAGALTTGGRLKEKSELTQLISSSGLDPMSPVITSCGSGVSAAIINLAFAVNGLPEPQLYDGSWTEWASRGDLPIEPNPKG